MTKEKVLELKKFAAQIRLETMKELGIRGFGHVGGSLSVVDVLAVLYGGEMKIDPKNPDWEDRDKLVMSKGHAGPAVYATLAMKGFFPMEQLKTLNQPGTKLPSHCDRQLTPGVDMTTGSLGQGTSTAIGLALAQKMDKRSSYTYLFTGDGELNEGQCWESALFAPNHNLDNLIWFVDYNHRQLDGDTDEVNDMGDINAKFAAFGWHTQTINGNEVEEVAAAIEAAKAAKGKPSCIVMNTVKGAGASCVSDIALNHHIVVDEAMLNNSLACINATIEELEKGVS